MHLIDVTDSPRLQRKIVGIIYAIVNTKTQQYYIGQTINSFRHRYSGGRWYEISGNQHLKNSFEKHGKECFKIYILEKDRNSSDLNALEEDYIKLFNSTNPCYGFNKDSGGASKLASQETKEKLARHRIGAYAPNNKKVSKYLGVKFQTSAQKFAVSFDNSKLKKVKLYESELEAAIARDKVALYLYGDNNCVLNFPDRREEYLQLNLEDEFKSFMSPKKREGYENKIALPDKDKLQKMLNYMNTVHLAKLFGMTPTGMNYRLNKLGVSWTRKRKAQEITRANKFYSKYSKIFYK